MGRISIHLDDATNEVLTRAAAEAGLSRSRWVRQAIREKLGLDWPESFRQLVGRWREGFPEIKEIRSGLGDDVSGEEL